MNAVEKLRPAEIEQINSSVVYIYIYIELYFSYKLNILQLLL